MSLFPEITSMNHKEYIEGILVSYKYFVNDKDVLNPERLKENTPRTYEFMENCINNL